MSHPPPLPRARRYPAVYSAENPPLSLCLRLEACSALTKYRSVSRLSSGSRGRVMPTRHSADAECGRRGAGQPAGPRPHHLRGHRQVQADDAVLVEPQPVQPDHRGERRPHRGEQERPRPASVLPAEGLVHPDGDVERVPVAGPAAEVEQVVVARGQLRRRAMVGEQRLPPVEDRPRTAPASEHGLAAGGGRGPRGPPHRTTREAAIGGGPPIPRRPPWRSQPPAQRSVNGVSTVLASTTIAGRPAAPGVVCWRCRDHGTVGTDRTGRTRPVGAVRVYRTRRVRRCTPGGRR